MKNPIALVLAAGSARRFGRDKRWVQFGDGRALIEEVLHNIQCAGLSARVVVRDDDSHVGDDWDKLIIPAPVAERGMGASLAAAAKLLSDDQACLICLADMPFIQPATYAAVAAALQSQSIIVPIYSGKRGHPVAFAAEFLPPLRALDGDSGARAVLQKYGNKIIEIAVDDSGIHRDIDTEHDLTFA